MGAKESVAKNSEGLRLEQSGDYEGAVQAFTQALIRNPESAAGYRNRAEVFRRLGREAEAQVDLEKAKAIAEPALLAAANRRRAQEQREWDEGSEARLTEASRGLVGL